ncbi:MAG: hypothetical protein ACLFRV_08110 [Acidimicrobiales bacterium]
MTYQYDSPQGLRPEFDKPGRPLSDWQVLDEVWTANEALREACGDSFATMVSHAYAELSTEATPEGPELTKTVWAAIEEAGYEVKQPKPIHFVKPKKKGFFAKVFGLGSRAGRAYGPRTRI